MSMVSHADVIGIVLFLILGAVSYYFYARISQLERKVGLMENILFDLKLTTEQAMNLLTEPDDGDVQQQQESHKPVSWSTPFMGATVTASSEQEMIPASSNPADTKELTVNSAPRSRTPPQSLQVDRNEVQQEAPSSSGASVTPNYEAMTYKELTQLAKQRGLSGLRNASKAQVIDALRGESTSKTVTKTLDISSWMQDATPLQDQQSGDGLGAVDSSGVGGTLLDANEVDASLVGEN